MKPIRNWLFSRNADLLLLFAPVWLTWVFCFAVPREWLGADLPIWVWVVFVLGIDVSHVWSTLFRTYMDREEFHNHRDLLVYTPLVCFGICFFIAAASQLWFWRTLAYFALFHFIRQQYGFMALYRARSRHFSPPKRFSDSWMIYLSMLYPVLCWHLTADRYFSWFVDGDFLTLGILPGTLSVNLDAVRWFLAQFGNSIYWLLFLLWFVEEVMVHRRTQTPMPWGKITWILTTAFNWYLGIVYFNSDLAFTVTNVVAHGIPYIVLVFFYVERKKTIRREPGTSLGGRFTRGFWIRVAAMSALILAFAMFEEFLWDMLLYRDYAVFFEALVDYPMAVVGSPLAQAAALALLSVPQTTHYVVDGFIWKRGPKNPHLKAVLS